MWMWIFFFLEQILQVCIQSRFELACHPTAPTVIAPGALGCYWDPNNCISTHTKRHELELCLNLNGKYGMNSECPLSFWVHFNGEKFEGLTAVLLMTMFVCVNCVYFDLQGSPLPLEISIHVYDLSKVSRIVSISLYIHIWSDLLL